MSKSVRRSPRRIFPRRSRPEPDEPLPAQLLEPVDPGRLALCWKEFVDLVTAHRSMFPDSELLDCHIYAFDVLFGDGVWTFPEITRASAFLFAHYEHSHKTGDDSVPPARVIERIVERASRAPLDQNGFFYDPLDLFAGEEPKAGVQ